jgi:hypothetical protein
MEKIVECSVCKKEMKGDFRSKCTKGEISGYACSAKCKLSFMQKAVF